MANKTTQLAQEFTLPKPRPRAKIAPEVAQNFTESSSTPEPVVPAIEVTAPTPVPAEVREVKRRDQGRAAKSVTRGEAPPARTSRSSALRRDTAGMRLSVYVPEDLEVALRIRCARERRSLSDGVTRALEAWLAG